MSALRARSRGGGAAVGGILGYPVDRVYQEVAILGRHAHWTLTEVLTLDHAERLRWVDEVLAQTQQA
ncbi:DUF6760 family protein [Nocardia sp. XZ_19_385]|uniref:DUF6760 family protein n=1 Tax=Nocardia sp. XZ_19_385 TaxID=2769488 RepID=UPI0035CD074D